MEKIGRLKQPWVGKIQPFKIIDGVYFVGTYQASSHLVDTGDGLILIDTGYDNTTYLVVNSIYELGFNVKDIKYIINTHWHGDHTEGTAPIADLSGARTQDEAHEILAKQLMAQGKINGSKEFADAMAQAWKDNQDVIKALPVR